MAPAVGFGINDLVIDSERIPDIRQMSKIMKVHNIVSEKRS
jgi:hypothetical protein